MLEGSVERRLRLAPLPTSSTQGMGHLFDLREALRSPPGRGIDGEPASGRGGQHHCPLPSMDRGYASYCSSKCTPGCGRATWIRRRMGGAHERSHG